MVIVVYFNRGHFLGLGSFDVYNVETALPKIEWDTVEANLRAASDEEKRVS